MPKNISVLLLIFALTLIVFSPAQAQDENLLSEARVPIQRDNVQGLRQIANLDMPGGLMPMFGGIKLMFSPDGKLLLGYRIAGPLIASNGMVRLWNVTTGKQQLAFEEINQNSAIIFDPHGIALFAIVQRPGGMKIGVWDISSGQEHLWRLARPQTDCGIPWQILIIFFDGQSNLMVYGSDECSGSRVVWNARTGDIISQWESAAWPVFVAPNTQDRMIELDRNSVNIIRISDAGITAKVPVWALNAAISPDESTLAVVGGDNRISVWDIASGEQVGQAEGYETWVSDVLYSPDGSLLVVATEEAILFWDAKTLELLHQLEGDKISSIVFSPDGSLVALVGLTNVTLWGVLE